MVNAIRIHKKVKSGLFKWFSVIIRTFQEVLSSLHSENKSSTLLG